MVIDPAGEIHPCLDADELWETMEELADNPPDSQSTHVAGTLMLQVNSKVRNGERTFVVVDPNAEAYSCPHPDDLWETFEELLGSDEIPATQTTALVHRDVAVGHQRGHAGHHEDETVFTVREDEQRQSDGDFFAQVVDEVIGDGAAEMAGRLIRKFQGLSYRRGTPPKPGSRRSKRRVKRGDIY